MAANQSTSAAADGEVLNAVLAGWTAAEIDEGLVEMVIERVNGLDLSQHYESVTSLLTMRTESGGASWRSHKGARNLALALWAFIPEDAEGGVTGADTLTESLNHPAGKLAEFWILRVGDEWRRSGEEWPGLSDELKGPLEMMLASDGRRGTMARAMLVTRLHMFAGADTEWCTARLLPCLSWTGAPDASDGWSAYLDWGRWTPRLLSAGLFEMYLETLDHVSVLGDGAESKLYEHLGSIAVLGEGQFAADQWIERFTSVVEPPKRIEWAKHVSSLLQQLPVGAREAAWRAWMRAYWERRLEGVPGALNLAEASAMVPWILQLGDSFSEGLDLALAAPAGFTEHSDLLSELTYEELRRSPSQFATLIEHLLSGTQPPFWGLHGLNRVLRDLRRLGVADEQLVPLLEAAAHLGFYEK